jgi:DNA-binding CsgD family transcriptional regulator
LQPRTSMSLDDWLSDPIFRKFLRPNGLGDGLTCPLFRSEGGFAAVATSRNCHYHQEHIDILRATAPHLRHALKVHLRLNSRDDSEAGLLALDHLRVGVLLSDAQGRMIWMNSAAEKILQEADGLSTGSAGFLLAARADETNRLRHLIRLAADHALRSDRQAARATAHPVAGGLIRLSRSSQAGPLELVVAPLRKPVFCRTGAIPARASVMIFISDPDEDVAIEVASLRQMYGLTAAEARLTANLVSGMDLLAAAATMGVTINTARTLLKRSFERTGTNRQSDLIGKILRGPLGSVVSRHPSYLSQAGNRRFRTPKMC